MEVASWHIQNHIASYSLHIWTGLSLFTLEFDGRVAYNENSPQVTIILPNLMHQTMFGEIFGHDWSHSRVSKSNRLSVVIIQFSWK
jgi:hypothetical protein